MPDLAPAPKDWYRIQARGPNAAVLYIYGDIGQSWNEDSVTAAALVKALAALGPNVAIEVRINSFGGSVADGLAIYNALRRHPGGVDTYNDGVALSIASLILQAGRTRHAAANAMTMMHAPWGGAVGNATDMREMADVLDGFADSMADAYARPGGLSRADVLALLSDGKDHWYSAQEALDAGLIDEIDEALRAAACLPKDRFTSIPAAAAAFLQPHEANPMPDKTPAVADPKDRTPEPAHNVSSIESAARAKRDAEIKARNAEIRSIFAKFMHHEGVAAVLDSVIDDPDISVEQAGKRLLAKLGEGAEPAMGPRGAHAEPGLDQRDKTRTAMASAILARVGKEKPDGANPYRGYRLSELARACVEASGRKTAGLDPTQYVRDAMHPLAAGQGTSDFPVILEDAMHKLVLTGFMAQPTTWERFCRAGDVSDFRAWKRLVPGLLGNLDTVNEHGEYLQKNIPDAESNSVQVVRRGNIISVTPETIVNDDTGYIQATADGLGRVGARAIERAVYALLVANPTLSDGYALFSSQHANLQTSGAVPSVSTVDAARVAMAAQTAPGDDAEYLDIQPYAWVGPNGLAGSVRVINASEWDPDTANKLHKPNQVRGIFTEIVGTPRLTGNPWYVFADPNVAPVIEVVFLDGQREPRLVQEESFRTGGLSWRVELPFGVGAIDYRGAYENDGA